MASPSFEKRNEFTDVIARVAEANRGAPLNRGSREYRQVVSAEPVPSVSSAAMRAPTGSPPVMATELVPEEVDRRNQRLVELGLLNPPPPVPGARGLTAGEFVSRRQTMPDFKKVQSIDIPSGVLFIDGWEFEIPAEDILEMKKYCVDVAMTSLSKRIAVAMLHFREEMDAQVQSMQSSLPGPRPEEMSTMSGESQRAGTTAEQEASTSVESNEETSHKLQSSEGTIENS